MNTNVYKISAKVADNQKPEYRHEEFQKELVRVLTQELGMKIIEISVYSDQE